ncbi:hypothetical protein [Methanocella arvoryzae]|uniref:hypothetical protein n=1 Tax=Methanocella arvoryzae TaxID=1175445 RepID=UPI000321DF9D|nr:hypothetical protein [Methanocella arvoryzae]
MARRMEVSEKGGMSVKEAGRKGGQATSKSHDRKFYEEIGHKGGVKGGQRVRELIQKGKEAERK